MHILEAAVENTESEASLATEDCEICFQFIHSLFDIYNLLPSITITLFDSSIFCLAIFSTLISDAAYCCYGFGLVDASNNKMVSVFPFFVRIGNVCFLISFCRDGFRRETIRVDLQRTLMMVRTNYKLVCYKPCLLHQLKRVKNVYA